MPNLTDAQIEDIIKQTTQAMRQAFKQAAGAHAIDEKKERLKRRIVAALDRSDDYSGAHQGLKDILQRKAMPKTLLRRALGGNAVNIDDALDELAATGEIRYYPTYRFGRHTLQVYMLAQNTPGT